jgi:ABC-type oligopeptide transport system ATPase subunit
MSVETDNELLQVRDLRVWFPIRQGVLALVRGWVRAVDGVTLAIGEGETLGLVGESGCGKSTLARTVARLETARSGSIRFRGRDLLAARGEDLRKARREMQMVFQDPFSSLNPRMTVVEIMTEGMVEHGMIHRRDRLDAAVRLLEEVGLGADAAHRFPHEFSGGQRQRISLARALSMRPSLVICDEPVSALDVSVQAQVINLLLDLKAKHNLSYMFISHDLSVVARSWSRGRSRQSLTGPSIRIRAHSCRRFRRREGNAARGLCWPVTCLPRATRLPDAAFTHGVRMRSRSAAKWNPFSRHSRPATSRPGGWWHARGRQRSVDGPRRVTPDAAKRYSFTL